MPHPVHPKMNKRKNTDESVIFKGKNLKKQPNPHETSFHVSSSARNLSRKIWSG